MGKIDEIEKRLRRIEKRLAFQSPVEIFDQYTMPDGTIYRTQDDGKAAELEAAGGEWDLCIVVHGDALR